MFSARLHRPLGIVVVLMAVVSQPTFAAKIYPSASVTTDVAAECFPTTNLGLGDDAYDSPSVVNGAAESLYESDNWPTATGGAVADPGGHVWRARAAAELDLMAGTARAAVATVFRLDNSPALAPQPTVTAGFSRVSADVIIRDTVTLSEPATVIFSGHISGQTRATNTDTGQDDPNVGAAVNVLWTSDLPIPGDPDGMHETYGRLDERFEATVYHGGGMIGDGTINPYAQISKSLYLAVALPAGKSRVEITLGAWANMDLDIGPPVSAGLTGDADFGNTLHFQIIVPEGIEATSGSGLLPLVVPEPASLTLLGVGMLVLIRRQRD